MLCTSTITFINGYIFYVLLMKRVPLETKLKYFYYGLVVACVVSILISIVGDTSSMFCGSERSLPSRSSSYEHGSVTQRIILNVVYVYPLTMMLAVNVIFTCFSAHSIFFAYNPDNVHMLPLLKRLMAFALAVLFCGVPKAISFFFFDDNVLIANISNSALHSSGVILSMFYFYYVTRKESPSSQRDAQNNPLRQGFVSSASSTPDDALRDSTGFRMHSEYSGNDSDTVAFRMDSSDSVASFSMRHIQS